MHYVNTKKINSVEVVVNFEPPSIDPESTKLIVREKIRDTDIFVKVDKLRMHSVKLAQRRADLQRESKKLKMELEAQSRGPANQENIRKEKAAVDKHFRTTNEQLESAAEAAMSLRPELIAEQKRLFQLHAIRFEVNGSHSITAEKKEALQQELGALKMGTFLTLDGEIIEDNRRRVYLHIIGGRWVDVRVEKLGQPIPTGAVWSEELTNDQKVAIRDQGRTDALKTLTPADLTTRKQAELDAAVLQSGYVKSGYEVEGRNDPLKDAKKWLKTRKAEIEEAYDVTG